MGVVIGYEEGSHGVRPAFITDGADAEKLVFDRRYVHNLATYLAPRQNHLGKPGKKALVVRIDSIIEETHDTRTLKLRVLDPEVAAKFDFRAGQFGEYSVFGAGECTFCIAGAIG